MAGHFLKAKTILKAQGLGHLLHELSVTKLMARVWNSSNCPRGQLCKWTTVFRMGMWPEGNIPTSLG